VLRRYFSRSRLQDADASTSTTGCCFSD